jgi:hypothetical protein
VKLLCIVTQLVVVIPYRRFKTTFWSDLQGSGLDYDAASSVNFLPTFRENLLVNSSGVRFGL